MRKRSLLIALMLVFVVSAVSLAQGQLIIYSWWTAGGEEDGLFALYDVYRAKYAHVEIINATVAGGAGTNAKAVLKTRMLGNDPPDSFQVHGGSELIDTWVKTGYMEPITDLWQQEGWFDVFPKDLVDMVSYAGEVYAVPSNIHRSNVNYYNVKLFEEYGVQPPTTLDEFFEVAEVFQAKGIPALAIGSRNLWEISHVFESVIAAVAGPEFYSELFKGEHPWTHPKVIESLEVLARMFEYLNPDHATLTWDQACGHVLQGRAAMTIMGDWAKGYFTANDAEPDVDFSAIPSPSTEGIFIVVTDTFGLPKGAPNRENAVNWLITLGSIEGQNGFNPKKGSIPARIDAPTDPYDVLALRTMEDFSKDILIPSVAHGSAALDAFASALNDEMGLFIIERNVEQTAQRLEMQAQDLGLR